MYAFTIGRELAFPEKAKDRELAQVPRFPCDSRNINDEAPGPKRFRSKPVYAKCVSKSWLARTGNRMLLEATPPAFTIFNLVIPDEVFRLHDLQYLQGHEELEKQLQAQADGDAEHAADDEAEDGEQV